MRPKLLPLFVAGALLLLCHVGRADPTYARVSFQGKLSNTNGNVVPDGSYDMVFKFYNAATAGTLLLTDRHVAGSDPVAVSAGLYSVLLGGGQNAAGVETNLWSVFLNHPEVYLGVSIGAEPEMTPRLLLTRAPYAVRADDALTLAGKSATQFVQVASNGNAMITGSATVIRDIVTYGRYTFNGPRVGRMTFGAGGFCAAASAGGAIHPVGLSVENEPALPGVYDGERVGDISRGRAPARRRNDDEADQLYL